MWLSIAAVSGAFAIAAAMAKAPDTAAMLSHMMGSPRF